MLKRCLREVCSKRVGPNYSVGAAGKRSFLSRASFSSSVSFGGASCFFLFGLGERARPGNKQQLQPKKPGFQVSSFQERFVKET